MIEVLDKSISDVKKEIRKYSPVDASLMQKVFATTKHPKKSYEILNFLDKNNRIRRFIHHFNEYAYFEIGKLKRIIEKGVDSLKVIEFLVIIRTPEANIRVDLTVIWPILLIVSVWFSVRAFRRTICEAAVEPGKKGD